MDLHGLINQLQQSIGLAHKADISELAPLLPQLPEGWHPIGDDTAAIPQGDGYLLLASEGLQSQFVAEDPWFAGWCGVMVNISDIAAMGGRATAVVNALWDSSSEHAREVMAGMTAAAETFGVPIIGGHTNLRSEDAQLSVSILGKADALLSSFAAKPGQQLVMAVDMRGQYREPYLNWNAATLAPPERLRTDLELLPDIANSGLAIAAKDISQAGVLGTTVMLLESSQVGVDIDLAAIPKPEHVSWYDWLCSFPSFGYLLTTEKDQCDELLARFHERDITAAAIGEVTDSCRLELNYENHQGCLYDLHQQALTGFSLQQSNIQADLLRPYSVLQQSQTTQTLIKPQEAINYARHALHHSLA